MRHDYDDIDAEGELVAGPGFTPAPAPVPQQAQVTPTPAEPKRKRKRTSTPRRSRELPNPPSIDTTDPLVAARLLAPFTVESGESADPHVEKVLDKRRNRATGVEAVTNVLVNVVAILTSDRRWRGRLRRDLLALTDTLDGHRMTDGLEAAIACWLGKVYAIHVSPDKIHAAVGVVAGLNAFHPVQDYLRGLKWDGKPRIDTWLTTYAGVDAEGEEELVKAYGAKWLISGVARAMEPGCKADSALVLAGPKGLRKSTTLRIMGGEWFGDSVLPIGEKDAYQVIKGKWVWELSELDSYNRRELGSVKAYLTSQIDSYRPSYARNDVDQPRQVIFGATVNSDSEPTFLREADRRWWVARVTEHADTDALARDRDELWAEAVHRWKKGDPWHLEDERLEEAQSASVAAFVQGDPWEEEIATYLSNRTAVTVADVLRAACQLDPKRSTKAEAMRVAGILGRLGWEKKRQQVGGERVVTWRPRPKP